MKYQLTNAGDDIIIATSVAVGNYSTCNQDHAVAICFTAIDGTIFAEAHLNYETALKILSDLKNALGKQ